MAENMEDVDYLYKLLGCDELSSEEQIIREYKIRAKALHPDKNSGDIETTNEFIT
jgi:DnaJ family protein C protein 12